MRFLIHYRISSGIGDHVVHQGTVEIDELDEETACAAAIGQIAQESLYFDSRIHPYIEITTVDAILAEGDEMG